MRILKQPLQRLLNTAGPRLARSPAARDLFFHLARYFTPSLMAVAGSYRYHVSTAEGTDGRELFLHGGLAAGDIGRIFSLLAQLGFRDFHGKYFLEIGANIGTTLIPILHERGFSGAVAIEADPSAFRLLRANVAANAMADRIHCVNAALSNRPDESGRLPAGDIPTATFDTLAARGVIPLASLGAVWIGTQARAGHVLEGAQSLLGSGAPVVVTFCPYALARSGGLARFLRIACQHYAHFVDSRANTQTLGNAIQPIRRLPALAARYPSPALTALLLLK
ncbi:MAG: hypothetical protein PHQ12_10045 [Chthoniobacteraceae bacterium]|nr:hypothetical protein [Chthoniobacteraceae bacterium]